MFPSLLKPPSSQTGPYSDEEIRRRIQACPKLASLQSINQALGQLVRSEHTLNSQIADVIRRDPSLTARLLRMVNSVYFGLSTRVNSIEEAVFFLGLRQIRELALATPVIDELEQLPAGAAAGLPWKALWTHSIAAAMLAREIVSATPLGVDDDTDYLTGLLHNVGKIVMACAFPDEARALVTMPAPDPTAFCALERARIGWDHGRIGAHYLMRHHLSDEIVCAVQFHDDPAAAPRHRNFAAAVQIADRVVRHSGLTGGFEPVAPVAADAWLTLPGWTILFGADAAAADLARAAIERAVPRLPLMLQGLL
jgi:HD-like signal output (HDOD) protein